MYDHPRQSADLTGQTLILSMRAVEKTVAYCSCYEFEDVVAEATGAQRIDVPDRRAMILSRRSFRIGQYLTRSPAIANRLAFKVPQVSLGRNYEFFFTIFNHPHETYALSTIPGWRDRCRIAACFLCEAHADSLPRDLIKLLSDFDHIFCGSRNALSEITKITGRPCTWLPFAADVINFAPSANPPIRTIDVCNVGRRSKVTHDALIEMARALRIFYYHDTVVESGQGGKQRTFLVENASEHRFLLANLLRRTRYFIANRSRANEPELAHYPHEISGRYYEGASAGAVLIGEAPRSEDFNKQFDWPDAVISIPFDAPDIGQRLAELDRDPERIAQIRRNNVHYAARRHDWVYRLRSMLETLGMESTRGMLARERRLDALAAGILES